MTAYRGVGLGVTTLALLAAGCSSGTGAKTAAASEQAKPNSAPSAPPKVDSSAPPNPEPTPGLRFLEERFNELMAFKNTSSFAFYGFSLGGPHRDWLPAVQAARDREDFSLDERIALGDLMVMGLEYVRTKGRETEYTNFARREIMKTMGRTK